MWPARLNIVFFLICKNGTTFEKSSYLKFHKNTRPVGVEFHADGQTDGNDEANSRFSQFDERA